MDFGSQHNHEIEKRLALHRQSWAERPRPEIIRPRILVTGFGLFRGVQSNITSALIQGLADTKYFLEDQLGQVGPNLGRNPSPLVGCVHSQSGFDQWDRIIQFRSGDIELRLLNLDVQWDFAAGIILQELELFRPEALLMLGQGREEIILEAGAYNRGSELSGFDQKGDHLDCNRVSGSKLVADGPHSILLKWPRRSMAERMSVFARRLGVSILEPDDFRDKNTYICNQVSYLTAMAAAGRSFDLAGRPWGPLSAGAPGHFGFMHLPIRETIAGEELNEWMGLMSAAIQEMI